MHPCQAPDPAPHAAGFPLPPLACDCHAHVFGDPARYPYRPAPRYMPAPAGLDHYRTMLAATGLHRAIVVQPDIYRDNQVTQDALSAAEGTWRGIARLDGTETDAALRSLHAAGFRGVRLDGRSPSGLESLEAAAARVAPFGWHVQLHLFARDLPGLAPRLRALPTPVVLDHFARIDPAAGLDQPGFHALLRLLSTGKTWVKLSAPYRFSDPVPPYPGLLPFARALVQAAPDRLLWGSDWPHTSYGGAMPNDGDLLDTLALWAPDAATRQAILQDNPASLYFQEALYPQ